MEQISDFFNSAGGQFVAGVIALLVFLIIIGNLYKKKIFSIKTMTFMAVCIALSVILSTISIKMPYGGSITILRMFFISVLGFWFGPVCGILGGITYGFLDFALKPSFYTPVQVILDYPLAFGMLGLSGFFANKKYGLQIGFCVAVLGRFICSTISGYVFFGSYAPEGMHPLRYSIEYNASYMLPELILTLIIISIPPFMKAITDAKKLSYNK